LALDKGPTIPCSGPADLARFFRTFFYLKVLMEAYPKIWALLSKSSKDKLVSCDVAWWTTVSLLGFYSDGSGLPFNGNPNSTTSSENKWGPYSQLARGIYARIHQAMGVSVTTNIKTIQILTSLTILNSV
jgi:hypothetical protein